MLGIISKIAGAVVSPVAKIFQKKQERKKVKEQLDGKARLAKIEGETKITLTDQEWEEIMAMKSDTTWKDEYLTVVVTAPFVLIIVGCLWFAWNGDSSILDGTLRALSEFKEIGIDIGYLMEVVIYAGVGLKVWRKI